MSNISFPALQQGCTGPGLGLSVNEDNARRRRGVPVAANDLCNLRVDRGE